MTAATKSGASKRRFCPEKMLWYSALRLQEVNASAWSESTRISPYYEGTGAGPDVAWRGGS